MRPSMTPTIEELQQEVTALWHGVACSIGPRRFRDAYRADPRGALLHCFSAPVIEAHRTRHLAIMKWLETAELPSELTEWDPTDGVHGSCMGDSGRNGAFIIAGDPPCCDLDPDYHPDQAERVEFVERQNALLGQLIAKGWVVSPMRPCDPCRRRIRRLKPEVE